jgi:hypothetical protein
LKILNIEKCVAVTDEGLISEPINAKRFKV